MKPLSLNWHRKSYLRERTTAGAAGVILYFQPEWIFIYRAHHLISIGPHCTPSETWSAPLRMDRTTWCNCLRKPSAGWILGNWSGHWRICVWIGGDSISRWAGGSEILVGGATCHTVRLHSLHHWIMWITHVCLCGLNWTILYICIYIRQRNNIHRNSIIVNSLSIKSPS